MAVNNDQSTLLCKCEPFGEGLINTMNCPIHSLSATAKIKLEHPSIKKLVQTHQDKLIDTLLAEIGEPAYGLPGVIEMDKVQQLLLNHRSKKGEV